MSDTALTDRTSATPLPVIAVIGGLAAFLALQLVAAARAGWVFEYPLDDVYIHLAIASEIARGGYGVNAGEITSAGSSAIYPLLLMFAPDSEFQRLLPLFWNVVGLVLTCVFWGRALAASGLGGPVAMVLALVGPIAAGAHAVAFTGMEHSLHAAASVAIVYGLIVLLKEDRLPVVLVIAMVLSPAFRFEGLALGLMAAGVICLTGRWVIGVVSGLLVLAPAVAFSGFLMSLGLDPLPNSVQAKLGGAEFEEISRLQRFLETFLVNVGGGGASQKEGGQALLGLVIAVLMVRSLAPSLKGDRMQLLVLVVAGAGLGHLFLGQIGWMERYEHYALAALSVAVLALAASAKENRALALGIAVLPLAWSGLNYTQKSLFSYPWNARAIHFQQAQMARYAQDYAGVNVAVNDLGRVVWGNPNYVLDLWGLANHEARRIRLFEPTPGWAGPLVSEEDVRLIMIYDKWLGAEAVETGGADARSPDWVKLGSFQMRNARGFLGAGEVDVYAASEADVTHLVEAMRRFQPTMPEDTRFYFEERFQ